MKFLLLLIIIIFVHQNTITIIQNKNIKRIFNKLENIFNVYSFTLRRIVDKM